MLRGLERCGIRTTDRRSRRRLNLEKLEHRWLLAADLLGPIYSPNVAGPQQNAEFGASLAVSESYSVVGAPPAAVDGIALFGQVAVYDSANQLIAQISNPNESFPAVSDDFGAAVAVSGETIVVAAPNEDAGATGAITVKVGSRISHPFETRNGD